MADCHLPQNSPLRIRSAHTRVLCELVIAVAVLAAAFVLIVTIV